MGYVGTWTGHSSAGGSPLTTILKITAEPARNGAVIGTDIDTYDYIIAGHPGVMVIAFDSDVVSNPDGSFTFKFQSAQVISNTTGLPVIGPVTSQDEQGSLILTSPDTLTWSIGTAYSCKLDRVAGPAIAKRPMQVPT